MPARAAFQAFLDETLQFFDRVSQQVPALLPFSHGFTDRFTGRGIFTSLYGTAYERGHFRREGDGDLLDGCHSRSFLTSWYAFALPLASHSSKRPRQAQDVFREVGEDEVG